MINIRTPDIKLDRNRDHLKYYTMLFIAFLQGYFKENEPGKFKWSEDLEKTELVIVDQDNNLTDKYLPRIVTVRGPSMPLVMNFNDFADQYDAATGRTKRSILIQSSITFHCIAKTGPEAQELAYQVYLAINAYYITIQKWGVHKVFRNINISPETPSGAVFNPEVYPEGRLIMCTVQFIYRNTFYNTSTALPAAKNIDLFINSALGVQDLKKVMPDKIGVEFKEPEVSNRIQDPQFQNTKI